MSLFNIQNAIDVTNAGISASITFTESSKDSIGSSANVGYLGYRNTNFDLASKESRETLSDSKDVTNAGISASITFTESSKDSIGSSANIGYLNFRQTTSFSLLTIGARVTQVALEVLATGDPKVRVTQVALEVLADLGPPPTYGRFTQSAIEMLVVAESGSRESQLAIEVLSKFSAANVQFTQYASEILIHAVSQAVGTQLVTELLTAGLPRGRVTQIVTELLVAFDSSLAKVRVSQQAYEALVKVVPTGLPTTTTTSTSTTTSTTTLSTTSTTHTTSTTVTFTFTIPDPRPTGSDRYPFVLPIPPETTNATALSGDPLPQMDFDDGGDVSVIGYGFFLGAFHPFDETSRSLLGLYVPPEHAVGGP